MHRGAPGGEVVFGPARGTMQVFYFADFGANAPAGVLGGSDGSLAVVTKIELDGTQTAQPTIGDVELRPGEWVRGLESGGGGYGDPLERDPSAVLADVLERWVSSDAALELYGVVLEGRDGELRVAQAATVESRRALRAARGSAGRRRRRRRRHDPGPRALSGRAMRCAIDTGGTFTDLAIEDRGELSVHKRADHPRESRRRRARRARGRGARPRRHAARAARRRRDPHPRHDPLHQRRPHRRDGAHGADRDPRPSRHAAAARGRAHAPVRLEPRVPGALHPAGADLRGPRADRRAGPRAAAARRSRRSSRSATSCAPPRSRRSPSACCGRSPTRATSCGSASCSSAICRACPTRSRTASTRRSGSTGAPPRPRIDASLKPLMGRYLGSLEAALRDAGFDGRLLVVSTPAA